MTLQHTFYSATDRPQKTVAIKNFLNLYTHPDLAAMYNENMEVQVLVAKGNGVEMMGDYKGYNWRAYQDPNTGLIWKSFRIPYAAAGNAEYEDREISFPLDQHAEAIGMTGWDWKNKVSKWVGFDFDAITGHATEHDKKLTPDQINIIKEKVCNVKYVTTRKSTGGHGLHLYIFLPDVPTQNHTEHAALARAILSQLSADVGTDLTVKVDVCGHVLWVFHKTKMESSHGESLKLIKQGEILNQIPHDWKDHIKVIKGKKKISTPTSIEEAGLQDIFEQVSAQRIKIPFDEEHQRVFNYLKLVNPNGTSYNSDHNMVITHTYILKKAHDELKLRGPFDTISPGSDLDHPNCFCFPLANGCWVVRRYSPGTHEAITWEQDGNKFTRCYYNRNPDFDTACKAAGGMDAGNGTFFFESGKNAVKAAKMLGVDLNLPEAIQEQENRPVELKKMKDHKVLATVSEYDTDKHSEMKKNWYLKRGKWNQVQNLKEEVQQDTATYNMDPIVRNLVSEGGQSFGWVINCSGTWFDHPLAHASKALKSLGFKHAEVECLLGTSVIRPWKIVNRPFAGEYDDQNREWNRKAARFAYEPADTENPVYPTWQKILDHCGKSLNEAVQKDEWCKRYGIVSGANYLMYWIASLFQEPREHLPYLFFYGPQNSGKSMFHEALSLLISDNGVIKADNALTNSSNFNGELQFAVLCTIEETYLKDRQRAYEKIKDWVTSRKIQIHPKGYTPYDVHNTTHWIQCANQADACPIFSGDTRITVIYVNELDSSAIIPKKEMEELLKKEARDFLKAARSVELPPSGDRLNIPILKTPEKEVAQQRNRDPIQIFIEDNCFYCPGNVELYSEVYDRFRNSLEEGRDRMDWTQIRFGKHLPPEFPKGKMHGGIQLMVGNISFTKKEPKGSKLVLWNGYLENENLLGKGNGNGYTP